MSPSKIMSAVLFLVASFAMYAGSRLSFWDVWVSLWTVCFFAGFLPIVLESAFFVKSQRWNKQKFAAAFLVTGMASALTAAAVGSGSARFTIPERCSTLLLESSIVDWILRFIGISGLYVFLYGILGTATRPFLRRYYDDPKNKLELAVPATRVILLLQVVRGTLTTAALIPMLALIPAEGLLWWAQLSMLLATVMGIIPLMMQSAWPARLRIIHGIEISAFAFAYSFLVWLMMAHKIAE